MKCQQPGCTGTIVDGYCDVCGMAPAGGTGATAGPPGLVTGASAPSSTSGSADGSRCNQPGCTGTIVDGYCDVCGTPAGAPAADSAAVFQDALDDAAAASGSFRLESAAIGSQRASGTGATHRVRSGSQRLRSARLGAGLTTIPPVPLVDAAKVVMKNPEVAEDKRNCAKCGGPVGRSKDGRPGRAEGFCPACGQEFSFTPKLHPGDLVAGQYEVAGCLAHGGLGWIYLARDKNVSDRWVVLKGLLNSGDADALAAAIAEQRFLAQVEHPLIVEIYNFVTHGEAGYIVMEYVGGRSLKQVLKERMRANNGDYDPLPVDQALAFVLEILPAFQYLHDLGLVYCDFKPDNLIQVGDALKLIDLGGVRHVDDQESAIYGTVGYQAPEVATAGPSVAVRHLHDRPHARRAVHGVQGLPVDVPLLAARPRDHAAVPRPRLALLPGRPSAAPPTLPTGSSPPTSCGCSCSECSARWWRRRGPVRRSPRPPRSCSRRLPSRRWRWTGPSCPACATTPPTPSTPG